METEYTIAESIKNILIQIGEDPEREGLRETPLRLEKAYRELLTPPEFNFTVFPAKDYDQMIIVKDIEFFSFCEHHILPFFGKVTVGYIPGTLIAGLSKIPRTVEYFARRLNTQEYFTQKIANFLQEKLKPLGVGVVVTGLHLCQVMRGVKNKGEMVTSCLLGEFRKPEVRAEFLRLIGVE